MTTTKEKTGQVKQESTGGTFSQFKGLASEEGAWVHIEDVFGEPMYRDDLPVRFRVIGCDSPIFKRLDREITNKRLANQRKKMTSEAFEGEKMKLISGCVVGWENVYGDNGTEIKFSEAAVRNLLSEPHMAFVIEQLDRFIGDRKNFLNG